MVKDTPSEHSLTHQGPVVTLRTTPVVEVGVVTGGEEHESRRAKSISQCENEASPTPTAMDDDEEDDNDEVVFRNNRQVWTIIII